MPHGRKRDTMSQSHPASFSEPDLLGSTLLVQRPITMARDVFHDAQADAPAIAKYFETWITGEKLFGPHDEDRFYEFVRKCYQHSKIRRTSSWLRPYLEQCDAGEYNTERAARLFDVLMDFQEVNWPKRPTKKEWEAIDKHEREQYAAKR